jgi:hypothetical protein
MPETVYLVPGFLATQLYLDPAISKVLWCNQDLMVIGQEGAMRLAPDGESPGPPDGLPLYPGMATPEVWSSIPANLQAQLGSSQYQCLMFTWDWRKDIISAGEGLAATIRADITASQPCSIAAHSAGGLVALAAWAFLRDSGNTNLVRRIVTMGTPFQGSYYPTQLLTQTDPSIEQLLFWNAAVQGTGLILPPSTRPTLWTWVKLFNLFATFPTFSELMPGLWGPLAQSDPKRVYLYNTGSYTGGFSPSQAWLNYSQDTWQGLLSATANHPPGGVLTCVAGIGIPTRETLLEPTNLNAAASYGTGLDGDGVVQQASAWLDTSFGVAVNCHHLSMPLAFTNSGLLAEWIADPRRPPDPPPPPEELAEVFPQNVTATPPSEILTWLMCIGGG